MTSDVSALPASNLLSRRTALRAGVSGAAALASLAMLGRARAQDEPDDDFDPGGRIRVDYDEEMRFNDVYNYPPMLGRGEAWRLRVMKEPNDTSGEVVRYINYDEVTPIYEAFRADPPRGYPHNNVWFDVGDGVIHSSWIVPVREDFNIPEETIGNGFWGEITVPTSWQHYEPKLRSRRYYDLAYGTVYKVVERADEPDGRAWYRIIDDLHPKNIWWIQATHVRRIQREEFAPISPDVPPDQKRITISIKEQLVVCYEYDIPVFATRIASGTTFWDAAGNAHSFSTPYGNHRVIRKTPSRRMIGGETIQDEYDLPGVPWCIFFTGEGAAIHGTYWHNDYGHPRSHGCVNVTNDASKWIYRWVNPYTGYDKDVHITTRDERDLATVITIEFQPDLGI